MKIGVSAVVSKRGFKVDIAHLIKNAAIKRVVQKSGKGLQNKLSEEIKQLLIEETKRLGPIKERTIEVSGEVGYELIKPLIG